MKAVLLFCALAVQSDDRNIQLLDHLDPTVRANAAEILGLLKVKAAVPALINRVDDPVLRVRSAAADSLKKITGKDFGTDYAQWQQWWDTEGRKKFQEEITSKEEVRAAVKEGLDRLEKEVDDAKSEIRILSITVAVISFVFVLVMIFFVGNVSSKLKEWKEVAKQTEVYLREGQEITKRTDKIMDELEGKKLDIVGFVNKLKEENQAELDRYSDLLQQNIDHRMREEVMALRQKAEKEIEETLNQRKGLLDHEIRQMVSEHKTKIGTQLTEHAEKFIKDVDSHSLYLEASFARSNKKDQDALRLFKRLLEMKPDHAVGWSDMGLVLRDMMRYDEASDAFQKALEFSPDDSKVLYQLAATFAIQKKRTEMLDTLARAIQNDGEFKDEALNDVAFKPYWEDSDFKDIAES